MKPSVAVISSDDTSCLLVIFESLSLSGLRVACLWQAYRLAVSESRQ